MKQVYAEEVNKYNYLYKETDYNIEDLSNPRFLIVQDFIHSISNIDKVLDAGIGRGTYFGLLASQFDAYGLEAREEAIRRYNAGNTRIKNILISDIPKTYSKEEFDLVNCLEVIEHIPPEETINNLQALLYATKKYLIISVANHEDIVDGKNVHINLREFSEWDQIFSQYCFIVEKIEIHDGRSCMYLLEKKDSSHGEFQYKAKAKPLFSILMPTYNQAHLIEMSLSSVINQSYTNWELVIVNDGSTDSTESIISPYLKEDNRIKLFNKENGGPSIALNHALNNAKGEWICWLSSDDLFEPDALDLMYKAIRSNPNYKFFHFDYATINDNEDIQDKKHHNRRRAEYDPSEEFQTLNFLQNNYVHGISWTAQKEVFEQVGLFDREIRYASDFDMWLRISSKYKLKYIDQVVAITREHTGADTSLFSNAGFYDSAISCLKFLNKNTFDKLVPNYDLSNINGIAQAVNLALGVSLNLNGFMYRGVGYVPALIDRLNEWISCSLPTEVIKWLKVNLIDKYLLFIKDLDIPNSIREAFDRLMFITSVKYTYQPYDPYKQLEENLHYLQLRGKDIEPFQKRADIELFINKIKEHQKKILSQSDGTNMSNLNNRHNNADLITVITPTLAKDLELLDRTIRSVIQQSYTNWEMIIVNDGGRNIADFINQYGDTRLIYKHKNHNEERSAARNYALKEAKGKYISYLDDDDLFYPNHLQVLINEINKGEYDVVYSDAIKAKLRKINDSYQVINTELVYSKDFDSKEILVGNFIPILCVLHKKECTDHLGGFDEAITMHEDYELWLRLSKQYKFKHIRTTTCEYTEREDNANSSYKQREKMLETLKYVYSKHSDKSLISPEIEMLREANIRYWNYEIETLRQEKEKTVPSSPLISIIIPVLNNIDYTLNCLKSIYETAKELPIEVIIIDNNSSVEAKSRLALEQDKHKNLFIIFNQVNESYSKANNQGASIARGKYLLFLNNDTKLLKNSLQEVVDCFESDPLIGIQGAKLLYPNDTIQHCGIVYGEIDRNINLHYHIYLTYPKDAPCVNIAREYQMITGAFLAIRNKLFKELGQFDEEYYFGHEDLDLCMKVRESGYKVWYNPKLVAYHYESLTKKLNGIEKYERYLTNPSSYDAKNDKLFHSKWDKLLKLDADDYYIADNQLNLVRNKSRLEHKENKPSNTTNNKLRVLITMYGWNESGGGTMFPKSVCKELAKAGIEVASFYATAIHPGVDQAYYLERAEEDGVSLYGVYNRPTVFLDVNEPLREIRDEKVLELFREVLDEFQPDIVHFQNFLGLSFAIADETKKRGIPSLYTPHNYHLIDPALYMINSDMKKWDSIDLIKHSEYVKANALRTSDYAKRREAARDLLNNKIDYTLAVSTKVQGFLKELSANDSIDNIYVVNQINPITEHLHNSIKKDASSIHSPIRFGFIGSVIPHKGIHNIVLASQLIPKGKAEFYIYGSGNEEYIELMKSMDQHNMIKWQGSYKPEDLPSIAQEVDVAIVPSIWEDCAPLVIAENLAMKLPVLGADIGGIRDFVADGINGKLYQYDSIKDLANIIIDIINNPNLIAKLRQNIGLRISFNSFVNHTISIYRDLHTNRVLSKASTELHYLNKVEDNIRNKSNNKMKSLRNTIEELTNKKPSTQVTQEAPTSTIDAMNRVKFDSNLQYGFSNKDAQGQLPNPLPSPLLLNLGCGKDVREGFLNIDLYSDDPSVILMDIRSLAFKDNSADLILASDILEHFSHRETDTILKEWARVLKPGGEIIIRCPSLSLQIKAYLSGAWNADIASYMIFGGQTNPGDYHCVGFDKASIHKHLEQAGLSVIHFEEVDIPQDRGYINLNMEVRARKK